MASETMQEMIDRLRREHDASLAARLGQTCVDVERIRQEKAAALQTIERLSQNSNAEGASNAIRKAMDILEK